MIFVDSDVLLIDLRYRRDARFPENVRFLSALSLSQKGVTSLYNLLEVCGILSFNLNAQQLVELFYYLPRRYRLQVYPRPDLARHLPAPAVGELLQGMARRASFGDSLIIHAARKLPLTHFVSWNARHFAEHFSLPVLPPAEALAHGILSDVTARG